MHCLNQFIPTNRFRFGSVFIVDKKQFTHCNYCNHYHLSEKLHDTQKTEQTDSFKVQQSNIFDANSKLAHILRQSSQLFQSIEQHPQDKKYQQKVDQFSTASNSKKFQTPTSCNSRTASVKKIIKLKPKHVYLKQKSNLCQ